MRIPYAKSDFAAIRRGGYFYVDKTRYLHELESVDADHVIFLRPRRFGKSTLISMLENYYDVVAAPEFDSIFGGLWIHEKPTQGKNKYLVLKLDFSPVDSEGTTESIRRSFARQVKEAVRPFIARYVALVPGLSRLEDIVDSEDDDDAGGLMTRLLSIVGIAGQQVYVLIDEYDHFGNRLLSDGKHETYAALVRGTGFVRSFYSALKAGTGRSALGRMFVTGVTPIMLDDLSSGFNIITHISQSERFDGMAGFTRADVEAAVDAMLLDRPDLASDPRLGDRDVLRKTLERYYNGYRFSLRASETMYNPTLLLYFVREVLSSGYYPRQMLDLNVRTDYGRLYRIATLTGAGGRETRDLLEAILTDELIVSRLVEQFGSRGLFNRAELVSLFYYMGMLTFAEGAAAMPEPTLVIPNRVMRELQWEYLSIAMHDNDDIHLDVGRMEGALVTMAVQGDIAPLIDLFKRQVIARISNRDLISFDEKTMKLMLMAYLSQSQVFTIMSEKELAGGYCDLLLGLRGNAAAAKFAWILEAKYVPTKATRAKIERAVAQAFEQLVRYTSDQDLVASLTLGNELRAGALVFVGSKDVLYRPWPPPSDRKRKASPTAKGRKAASAKRGTRSG